MNLLIRPAPGMAVGNSLTNKSRGVVHYKLSMTCKKKRNKEKDKIKGRKEYK